MIESASETTDTGRITMADVRFVMDAHPEINSANAIRAVLRRGSFGTIDKHLKKIRAERAAALLPPVEPASAGATAKAVVAPAEALATIWSAAVATVTATVMTRLNDVTVQRDELLLQTAQQAVDLDDAAAAVDEMTTVAEAAQAAAAVAATALAEAKSAAATEAETAATAAATAAASAAVMLETVRRELSIAVTAAQAETTRVMAAAELAQRDAQIQRMSERQALQDTINKLTDQVAELKSWIHRPGPVPQTLTIRPPDQA